MPQMHQIENSPDSADIETTLHDLSRLQSHNSQGVYGVLWVTSDFLPPYKESYKGQPCF